MFRCLRIPRYSTGSRSVIRRRIGAFTTDGERVDVLCRYPASDRQSGSSALAIWEVVLYRLTAQPHRRCTRLGGATLLARQPHPSRFAWRRLYPCHGCVTLSPCHRMAARSGCGNTPFVRSPQAGKGPAKGPPQQDAGVASGEGRS